MQRIMNNYEALRKTMAIRFKLIAAMSANGGIGYKGGLPWPHNKADMAHFAKRTTGAGNNAVVMGKTTWFSIPARPLRNRANLILSSDDSRDQMQSEPHAERWFKTIPELLAHLESANYDEVWIIGGASIYEQFLAMHAAGEIHIDEMCITTIEGDFECDTFFPRNIVHSVQNIVCD